MDSPGGPLLPPEPSAGGPADVVRQLRARTPARVLVGRTGPAYRTATQLELRRDHAAAVDAVHAVIDLHADFPLGFAGRTRPPVDHLAEERDVIHRGRDPIRAVARAKR